MTTPAVVRDVIDPARQVFKTTSRETAQPLHRLRTIPDPDVPIKVSRLTFYSNRVAGILDSLAAIGSSAAGLTRTRRTPLSGQT